MAAVSADSAWAFGVTYYTGRVELGGTLILHWNGTTWTQVPSPNLGMGEITGVATTSASSAWAVGNTGSSGSIRTATGTTTRPFILHWNGSAWTTVPNPSAAGSYLNGVAATPAGIAWAVGRTSVIASRTRTLILWWNGTAWTRVPSPSPGPYGSLMGVTALSNSDAWAVGTAGGKTLILRWNGRTWSGPASG